MKLAEALILRADAQKRLEQLKQRLYRNAKVQEGDEPGENPAELLAEFERVTEEFKALVRRINRTNAATVFEADITLSDALAERDNLKLKHQVYRDMAVSATVTQDRYTKSEIKFKSTVDIPALQKQADETARTGRELDTRIQQANWVTDLMD